MSMGLCTKINFELVCAVCDTPLAADTDKGSIESKGAWETTAKMAILPCQRCIAEIEKPVKLISKGLALISESK